MSRTPARCTQADIARALRAIAQAGGDGWAVEVLPDGTIRIGKVAMRPPHRVAAGVNDDPPPPKKRIIL